MGASFHSMIASALTSLFFVVLFRVERARGVRFGESIRSIFDRMILSIRAHVHDAMPPINDHFLQELFYFSVHKTLSVALGSIRKLERIVLRIVRFNRMQVVRLRTRATAGEPTSAVVGAAETAVPTTTSDHLVQIAAHKKEVELTAREKQKRKEHSISGDGPF